MTDRFPGYDVLAKRDTPSWNAITRRVVDERLAVPHAPRFLDAGEYLIAEALSRRILPQPPGRDEVPIAAMLDAKLFADSGDGFREGTLPYMREAWRRGLAAIDREATARHGCGFVGLTDGERDDMLRAIQHGDVHGDWEGLDPALFFAKRVLIDIPGLYYSHPTAWSEIGFGGPASPRGYVRLGGDRRDPWEAAQAYPGREERALIENKHVV